MTPRSLFVVIVLLIIAASCSTPSVLVTREQQTGDSYFNQHNYSEAIIHYNNMMNSSAQLGIYRNLTMEAEVYRKIANCYEMQGKYDDAFNHIRLAFERDSLESNNLKIIEDYRLFGRVELYRGDNINAIRYFEKALGLSEGMDQSVKNLNRNSIAENKLVLGQLYTTMGRFRNSLSLIAEALDLFRSTGNRRGEMEALLTMGSVYFNLGDNDLASRITDNSMAIAKEINASSARHLNNLARIAADMGEYEEAIRNQQAALTQANSYNIAAQKIWYTIRLGDLYRQLGDPDRAMKLYREAEMQRDTTIGRAAAIDASIDLRLGDLISARDYFTEQGSDVGSGIAYLRMAELTLTVADPEKSFELFEKAGEFFARSGNSTGMANVLLHEGIIRTMQGRDDEALRLLDRASEEGNYPEIKWQSAYQKGIVFEKADETIKAKEQYLRAIEIIEQIRGNLTIEEFKSSFINDKIDVYDRLINIYLRLNDPQSALEVTEKAKARTFFEMLANREIVFSGETADSLISEEQEKRFRIQQLYKQLQNLGVSSSTDQEVRQANRRTITAELSNEQQNYSDLLLKIKLSNPAYSQIVNLSPVKAADIRQTVDNNTAVLSYWISNSNILIWCITDKDIVQKSVPVSSEILAAIIENARKHIATNAVEQAKNELSTLYRYLLEPVEKVIGNRDRLIIVPNRGLHFLPFQALRDNDGKYMVERFIISYEPSLGVMRLSLGTEPGEGRRFFGAALSDISIGLNTGLPGTKDEVERILPLFKDNLSSFAEKSTETFVKENIGRYNYVHLATHGFFNFEQPVYSFLLFPPSEHDDGRLTVYEVLGLKLDARLVTLSACETGLGYLDRGDEIVGLGRSFLYSGSSAVIVSLWSVADYQTSLLMSKFYSSLDEYSLVEAMAMAQREVIKQYPNPFYWAPFVILGK